MQDKFIDSALLTLRKQMIRGDDTGLDHVLALLAMRGVALPRVLPAKRKDSAKRGQVRRVLLNALRGGPKPLTELVAVIRVWKPEVPERLAYRRTQQALNKMKAAGLVTREGRLWGLAP